MSTSQVQAPAPSAPPATAGQDLDGVIAFVESQLRQLGELCAQPAPAEQRPLGLTLDELGRQRDALANASRAIAEREAQLQAWHDQLEATQHRLATEHEAVVGTLEQRRTELNTLDGSLRTRNAQAASRRESLAAREASLTRAECELAARERRFASTQESLNRRGSELDAASVRLQDRASRLAERAESVRLAESQADARASAITGQYEDAQDPAQKSGRQRALAAEAATLRATVVSLQARLDAPPIAPAFSSTDPAAREETHRIVRQRDALARELSDRERMIEQLSADCRVLRADADAALSRGAEQDRTVRRLEGRLAEAQAISSGQSADGASQRAALRAAHAEAASVQQRLETFRSELDLRHEEITDRARELDLREADLERSGAAFERTAATFPPKPSRPDMPGVTALPAGMMTVPSAWFGWEAPRRGRRAPDGSVHPASHR